MTIYYSLTFMLLAAEMGTFCVLVAPLPYRIKKTLFTFLSESVIVAKVAYALKISFIFVAILFVDALQRMFRITADTEASKNAQNAGVHDVRTETGLAARKFYAQRNVYLTGFCLFLSLVLTRTFYIILDLIHTQEEYAKIKKQSESSSNGAESTTELKKKIAALEAKDRDFETLKKQASQQAAEFDRLATEYNTLKGQNSDKKQD
ncbi:endoplasmic reticulum protein [Pleurotus eryngii]|uniref:Endoplasmic reticulum transmembrane protein n=1 Tax=Pleurotus eryngii TaxID=5323 RepID=A0A9P6DAF6_PLEER|nr:endoplasmic reticulum protein [Pleurotus eryngii]